MLCGKPSSFIIEDRIVALLTSFFVSIVYKMNSNDRTPFNNVYDEKLVGKK